MIQLIYTSQSAYEMTLDQLQEIAHKSQNKNMTKGITGILLYRNGTFLQVLEGEDDDVVTLFLLSSMSKPQKKRDRKFLNCGETLKSRKRHKKLLKNMGVADRRDKV